MGCYDVVGLHESLLAYLPVAFNDFRDVDSLVSTVEWESCLVVGKVTQVITQRFARGIRVDKDETAVPLEPSFREI